MGKKILIIGGVACGCKTAARLMRIDPEAEVTILEKGEYLSYAGCGLPYYVGGVVKEYKDLMSTPIGVVRDATFFRKVKHVDVHTGHLATKIDRENHVVTALDLASGKEKRFPYNKLVIATGASPIRPPIPGADLPGVLTLWNIPDALSIRSAIDGGNMKRAVIIGGGLVGMEAVEALCNQGLEVSVVDILETPLPAMMEKEFGLYLIKALKTRGVNFYGGEKVQEIVGCDGKLSAVRTDKREIPADMVLMAVGVRPNTAIAKDAGLEIGEKGGIIVDAHMRTSDPDIYAGGDCVEAKHLITGERTWQPMGSVANRQGRVIADNIAGMPSTFHGVTGTAILRVFEYTVGKTGLTRGEAALKGFDAEAVTVLDPDKPHYMPGSAPVTIRLVADKKTRKVLGGQVFGPGQADKRLDTLATAVSGGLDVDMLANTDLAYAPPYSTALDPIAHAANALRNKMDGLMKSIGPSELKQKIEGGWEPLLVDVRTPGEVENHGRLPYEFVNIPLGMLWEKARELPKDKDIVTYCKVSVRGWDAYAILSRLGFEKVFVLEGGIAGWPFDLVK